jgi:hypothetical protein
MPLGAFDAGRSATHPPPCPFASRDPRECHDQSGKDRQIVLCSCAGSQTLTLMLSTATGRPRSKVHDALCLAAPDVVGRASSWGR